MVKEGSEKSMAMIFSYFSFFDDITQGKEKKKKKDMMLTRGKSIPRQMK